MRTIISRRLFLSSAAAALAKAASSHAPGKDVRIGIVGLGGRGTQTLIGFTRAKGVSVAAICDVDRRRLQRGAALARRHRCDADLASHYNDLIERPDLDAIALALPKDLSVEAALGASKSKKHVFLVPEERLEFDSVTRLEAIAVKQRTLVEVYELPSDPAAHDVWTALQGFFRAHPREVDVSISCPEDPAICDQFGVLKTCLRVLSTAMPSHVSVLECPGRSILASFTFEDASGATLHLRWEMVKKESPGFLGQVSVRAVSEHRNNSLDLVLPRREEYFPSPTDPFKGFSHAVRTRDVSFLSFPIAEARRRDAALCLANRARDCGHSLQFQDVQI